MIFMTRLLATIVAATAMSAIWSCSVNDDTIDGDVTMTRYDVVTYGGAADGIASFVLIGPDDSGERTIHARASVDTSAIAPGDRMILTWAETTGDLVSFRGATPIYTGPLSLADARLLDTFRGDPVYLMAMWRTGPWLNVRARLSHSEKPRIWQLTADSATLGFPTPRLRLLHRLPKGVSADSTWMATTYSSFDVSPIVSDPAVTSFTVEVDNSNLTGLKTLTFNKKQ